MGYVQVLLAYPESGTPQTLQKLACSQKGRPAWQWPGLFLGSLRARRWCRPQAGKIILQDAVRERIAGGTGGMRETTTHGVIQETP